MSRRSSSAGDDAPAVAILGYHKIGEPRPGGWPTWFYTPEATFAGHLEFLERSGWRPIGLGAFLAGLEKPGSLPRRATLLTFDDGHRSFRHVALPWLRRFGYPAVMFVPVDFVGHESTFDEAEPIEPLCDWDDLRALERSGVSIQSHGATHRAFSGLDAAAREAELLHSRQTLEAGLGTSVEIFAFPYGDDGGDASASRSLLEGAGYRGAVLYGGGLTTFPADPYRLARIAMGPDTDLRQALR
jgi:peptidoglycan/xylan/chitin deacetylase (PgdA/CDA1 family)